ncbi:MAG TPA: lipoyl domain-containing protein, partial [Dehalococcoidia bacterium]|nr:lipoyl domain-containing protein [Dehalococcoidia bacterium]
MRPCCAAPDRTSRCRTRRSSSRRRCRKRQASSSWPRAWYRRPRMVSEVVMPQMGADMTEGTLLRWLKEEGDSVERGDIIAEIETDKANIEIEAFEAGVFRKVL